jgi:hypothetical protein
MQLIPNREDREFLTSKGHWTGDGVWDPGPVVGKSGLQKVTLQPDLTPGTIILQYPYIKAKAGLDNDLIFYVCTPLPTVDNVHYTLRLTDGNYDYVWNDIIGIPGNQWTQLGDVYSLPDDWDETQTTLIITLAYENDDPVEIVYDDFSLEAEVAAKEDHLPLMGVH